jgi:hypothetical protein
MNRMRETLRSGDWLTRERARLIAVALIITSAAGLLFLVVTAHHGVDLQGRPLGTDFSNVYAAGTYVWDGNTNAAFDPPQQFAREQAIFGATTQFYGWHYPPYFLFLAAALSWMPYGLALAVWQAVTLGLYLLVMRGIVASFRGAPTGPASGMTADWLLLVLAFPAVMINIGHGQNGFLTTALMGGALVLLDRRPIVAGILFGLLVYKPQYGLLLPIALGVNGRWKCFAAAAATIVALTVATTLTFGVSVWQAFLDSTHFTRTVVLEQGNTGWYKIQSVFSWARMWGAPISLAYALQGAAMVALAAAIAKLWRSASPYPLQAAALCLATILATPYSFDYDMMLLAPAIAFVAVDGLHRGFAPWEKTLLAALWLMPLLARSIAHVALVPLGVPAMVAVFVQILRCSGAFRGAAPVHELKSQKLKSQELKSHDIAAFKS